MFSLYYYTLESQNWFNEKAFSPFGLPYFSIEFFLLFYFWSLFSFPFFFFSTWELRCACMLYYARTAPSIKARRAFTRVLVAFTVSEKRPTKVCGTRELRYMTKLCVCMSDFPSLEIYFVNTKQGENTIFVRKKKY